MSEPSPASAALAELLGMLGMDRDINRADPSSGRTLLHALAAEGDARLLELALSSCPDAELERTDRHGQAPLNLAARHGHADVVEVGQAGQVQWGTGEQVCRCSKVQMAGEEGLKVDVESSKVYGRYVIKVQTEKRFWECRASEVEKQFKKKLFLFSSIKF